MSISTLSEVGLYNGRRNISQPLPNPTPYASPVTYTRPSDWTALPTVADTYYCTGIYAVYNNESNYVALTCATTTIGPFTGYISNGAGTSTAGTILSPTGSGTLSGPPAWQVGMQVTGAGVTANTLITGSSTATFTGSATGLLLTVTSVTSGTLTVGMVINNSTSYITSQASGTTGGAGTYNLSATVGATVSKNNAWSFTVNNSQFINNQNITGFAPTYTVDWGDGTVDTVATGVQAQHNYVYSSVSGVVSSRGYKTAPVTITTSIANQLATANFNVKYTPTSGTVNAYYSRWLDMRLNCNGATNFTLTGTNAPLNMLEQVQVDTIGGVSASFASKFSGLRSFQSLILNSGISVASWASAFASCSSLVSAPSLSATNTNLALTANSMFSGCTNLLYCPDYTFNSSVATDFTSMFDGCRSLEVSPNISGLNGTVGLMFQSCVSLRKLPTLNTKTVSNFFGMFNGCTSLSYEGLPLLDTSGATNTSTMFQNCTGLTSVPLFNTINVINATSMFSGCNGLLSVPLLNLSNATATDSFVRGCSALTSTPFWNTSKVTNMSNMFASTTNLVTIANIDCSNVTNMANIFTSSGIKSLPLLNTGNVTNMAGAFQLTVRLTNLPTLDTSKVSNMDAMFNQSGIIECPSFNTSNVTSMNNTFGSSKIQNMANLNTSNVTNMQSMFNSCQYLTTVPPFDTSKVTNMNGMFLSASRLQNIPSFNMSNVSSNPASMFSGCNNLTTFNAASTSNSSLVTWATAFQNTQALVEITAPINLGNITAVGSTLTFGSSTSLASLAGVSNAKFSFTIASSNFGKTELERIFGNVIIYPGTTAQVLTITSNPGADTANSKTSGMTAGSNVVTMANTAGIIAGSTYLYGTGMNTGIPVTFTDAGDTVQYTNGGGVNGLANGDTVMFTSIVSTSGIVINTPYTVISRTGTTFQLGTYPTGTPLITLTTNGTGVMSIGGATVSNKVLTVNANANVIISGVAGITNAAASLTARNLNINQAVTKNWTITG